MIQEFFFVGFQTDIENWLSALDVFVLPSLTEGTPMALLEAMVMEIPVIVSAVGGVPKVVFHMESGFLVPPGDHQAICNALNILKNDPKLKDQLAKEGANTVKEQYDIRSWCRKIENVYRDNINSFFKKK